jgi:membrane-associated phospholipid phosphatase
MMKVVFVLLMLPSLVAAQYDSVKRRIDPLRFADGVIHTYTSPVRWKGKDWLKFGALAGGTALLTLADHPVRNFWQKQNGNFLDGVNEVGYHYGKPYSAFIFSGGFYTAGLLFKNEWAKETGLALTTALFASGLLEMGLKPLVGRARPGNDRGNYDRDFLNESVAYHSFPSGHATVAFTISFVMAKQIDNIPMKIFFYTLATSTAICRLYSDAHWVSDIGFGSIIAWHCSEAVIKRLQSNRHRNPHKKTKWNLTPYPGGITLRATFK